MAKIPFNVDAYTARLIGRENVSKLGGAILELIKNTYDADAKVCVLYYEDSTKSLYIADNGHGMTKEVIMTHWMTIGYSSKVETYKTEEGRTQTGSKGIGRFALDRISDSCMMLSKTIESASGLEWEVNWNTFRRGKPITETHAELDVVSKSFDDFVENIKNEDVKEVIRNNFSKQGTIFRLTSLREEDGWSNDLLLSIKKDLSSLFPPEISSSFQIYAFNELLSEEEAKVIVDDGDFMYDYKLSFDVDSDGKIKIVMHRDEFDFKNQFDVVMKDAKFTDEDIKYFSGHNKCIETNMEEFIPGYTKNSIGAFSGVLYMAKGQASKEDQKKYFYKDVSLKSIRNAPVKGIRIYRDNFRVRPYGDSQHFDWLGLAMRKNQSPASVSHPSGSWRVSVDQVVGTINISRDNINLPDQSNREGIQETKEFSFFKILMTKFISIMEVDRQYVARKLRKYNEDNNSVETFEQEIKEKATKKSMSFLSGLEENSSKLEYIEVEKAKAVIDQKDETIGDLEEENNVLRALATTGIIINSVMHEIRDFNNQIGHNIKMAEDAILLDKDIDEALINIDDAKRLSSSFNSWLNITVSNLKRDKRKLRKVALNEYIGLLVSSWNDILRDKAIKINLDIESNIEFYCFVYEIESIFNNLISNSKKFFARNGRNNKNINISLKYKDGNLMINYSDNGFGLIEKYKKDPQLILTPFETSSYDIDGKGKGIGMGLWIVDNIVKDYGGYIDLSKNKNEKEGFFIEICLKNRGK